MCVRQRMKRKKGRSGRKSILQESKQAIVLATSTAKIESFQRSLRHDMKGIHGKPRPLSTLSAPGLSIQAADKNNKYTTQANTPTNSATINLIFGPLAERYVLCLFLQASNSSSERFLEPRLRDDLFVALYGAIHCIPPRFCARRRGRRVDP